MPPIKKLTMPPSNKTTHPIVDTAAPKLVHDQFGQKHPIPKNGGKTIEFRKYSPLPKLLTPLTEGVTPDGQSLSVSTITATVAQYGGYVTLSDMLLLTAIDNNLVQATKLLGNQAGATLDTITREVLNGGTNVQYGENSVSARYLLTGGKTSGNHYLTVDCIRRAVRFLKSQNAEKINGAYILDTYYEKISPELLQTELDVCWVNVGGENPAEYVKKYAGRAPIVHLKDFYKAGEKAEGMYELIGIESDDAAPEENPFEFRPVGFGVQDMPAIIKAAEDAGAGWLVVEQDQPSMGLDPMQCAEKAIGYLRSL